MDTFLTQTNTNTNTCATKLPNFTKADLEIIHKRLKPEEKIRKKVKEKLEVRFLNGEIKREEMQELEEELVRDLEAELLKNL